MWLVCGQMKKTSAEEYYNTVGWKKKNGRYVDELVNTAGHSECEYHQESLRLVTKELGAYFHAKNPQKLLDCACGPLYTEEQVNWSRIFQKRICVDFSVDAINAAQTNLANSDQEGEFYATD